MLSSFTACSDVEPRSDEVDSSNVKTSVPKYSSRTVILPSTAVKRPNKPRTLYRARATHRAIGCLDIIHAIFRARIDPDSDYCDSSRTLSQVCRFWRTSLISTPTYWTAVKMRCGRTQNEHLWAWTILRRSKGQLITFFLYVTAPFQHNEVKRVMDSHAGHIHKLFVETKANVPPTAVWPEIQLFMSQNFLVFDYHQKEGMHVRVVRNTSSAAQLSHAKPYPLIDLPITDEFEYRRIMWSTWHVQNITSLTLDYMELGVRIPNHDLCAILSRNMTTLKHLKVINTAPLVCALEVPDIITLPHLTSLSMGYVRAGTIIPFIKALRLPRLRSLIVRDVARAPESLTPYYIRGVLQSIEEHMEGAVYLLAALSQFTTVTYLKVSGMRCPSPGILLDTLNLESLTLIDSDDVFRSLICSIPAPRNGWAKNSVPGLTLSGLSLAELTVTTRSHEPFVEYLTKRIDAGCPPLRRLTMSPCCLHSAYADDIKEKKWEKVDGETDTRIELAMKAAKVLKVVPQPLLGQLERTEEADLLIGRDHAVNKEALWRFIPPIIQCTESDSEDDDSGEEEEQSLKNDPWEMEF